MKIDQSHLIDTNDAAAMFEYLYSEERNVRVATFFDQGYNMRLGDAVNGMDSDHWEGHDLLEGLRWLVQRHMTLKAARAMMTPAQRLQPEFSRAKREGEL